MNIDISKIDKEIYSIGCQIEKLQEEREVLLESGEDTTEINREIDILLYKIYQLQGIKQEIIQKLKEMGYETIGRPV